VERGCSYELDEPPGASAGSIPHSVLGGGLVAGSPSSPSTLGRFISRSRSLSASRSGRLRLFEGLLVIVASVL
jgi:hypothetical protein